jgi:hypothetical protein
MKTEATALVQRSQNMQTFNPTQIPQPKRRDYLFASSEITYEHRAQVALRAI